MKSKRESRRDEFRKKIRGSADRPRLSVFKSNRYFYSQIIDDVKGMTLASAKKAEELVEKLKKLKIDKVVFDRSGFRYHGKVKEFAEAVRAGGIKI